MSALQSRAADSHKGAEYGRQVESRPADGLSTSAVPVCCWSNFVSSRERCCSASTARVLDRDPAPRPRNCLMSLSVRPRMALARLAASDGCLPRLSLAAADCRARPAILRPAARSRRVLRVVEHVGDVYGCAVQYGAATEVQTIWPLLSARVPQLVSRPPQERSCWLAAGFDIDRPRTDKTR